VHVETIRALWRGVDAARAGGLEDAVTWFNIADTCAVHRGRRARWNLDAVLRLIILASRGYSAEPTLEAVWELEKLLLSKAQPGCSRRLFDGLWKRWCRRANKSETPWEYQLKGKRSQPAGGLARRRMLSCTELGRSHSRRRSPTGNDSAPRRSGYDGGAERRSLAGVRERDRRGGVG